MIKNMSKPSPNLCACGCLRPCGTDKFYSRHKEWNHTLTRKSDIDYVEEDRGYETPCWIWQLKIAGGYGHIKFKGEDFHAHIYYYEQYRGRLPEYARLKKGRTHELDHLCRVRECVNPWHLELVQRNVNVRRGNLTKLTEDQVREISYKYKSGMSQSQLSLAYRVSQSHIGRLLNQTRYSGVITPVSCRHDKNLKITPQQVVEIRKRVSNGETQRTLAREYGIGDSQVSRIIHGQCWSNISL